MDSNKDKPTRYMWRTREGDTLRIEDMEDSHIENAYKYFTTKGNKDNPKVKERISHLKQEMFIRSLGEL